MTSAERKTTEETEEMISLHDIYCPCMRCELVRKVEKQQREKL